MTHSTHSKIEALIDIIPNFPQHGIQFRDISPLLRDPSEFGAAIKELRTQVVLLNFDYIAGIESRGFIIGTALANLMNVGFIPLRKPGKLPKEFYEVSYNLEYGEDKVLCMHKDAIPVGSRVLIVDDLLATGGSAEAAAKLIRMADCEVAGAAFLIELMDLKGRQRLQHLKGLYVFSMLAYGNEKQEPVSQDRETLEKIKRMIQNADDTDVILDIAELLNVKDSLQSTIKGHAFERDLRD